MNNNLPILPTSVIGSYAYPGWLHLALDASTKGEYGVQDMQEAEKRCCRYSDP